VNSPKPGDPPKLVIDTAEMVIGDGLKIRIPTGEYTAPQGGAPLYQVPGPIVAFRGVDGQWRGHGYLETYPRLLKFKGTLTEGQNVRVAKLEYTFEKGKTYEVRLTARGNGAVAMDETCDLGPRNLFVFDCYYNWQPTSAFVTNLPGTTHAFLYLPCYYDKPEATINPAADLRKRQADRKSIPGGVAVLHPSADSRDVVALWCRSAALDKWENGRSMGLQLWQRRQLPGDPGSRHFLGPETKSDSTPNPRTADMLGKSLYEGHVTIELNLGEGSRRLGFAVVEKGSPKDKLPQPVKKIVQNHQN
jgi:hypothetical protein